MKNKKFFKIVLVFSYLIILSLFSCNVYKRNNYQDRSAAEYAMNKYINDSLKFGIYYFGDYDIQLERFKLKGIVPKEFYKEAKNSLMEGDEILYIGKTDAALFISTLGIVYNLNNKNIDSFSANHLANLRNDYNLNDSIEYQAISSHDFKLEYNLTGKLDKWEVKEYLRFDKNNAIRIVFLYSFKKNKDYNIPEGTYQNEVEEIIQSWSASKNRLTE